VSIVGPDKFVGAALAAVEGVRRQFAREEVPIDLVVEEVGLVRLHLRSLNKLQPGVTAELVPNENRVVLCGTLDAVAAVRHELDALLIEAESGAVQLTLNTAQLDKLMRHHGPPQQGTRTRETLLRKLQESCQCAMLVERETMVLSLRGRAAAVARAQQALEHELDVDSHERVVPSEAIKFVIGKGGSTIKRLMQESGASFDVKRETDTVCIQGRKANVAKGCELLDELLGGQAELRVLPRQVPLIIGRGGATIKQLQADSGANIAIAKEDSTVQIRGSKQAVDLAMQLLQKLISPAAPSGGAAGGASHGSAPPGLGTAPSAPPGLQ